MDTAAREAIERAKVREVAAIFHSEKALDEAARALQAAGFDRADMDRLADFEELRKRLGPVYVAHEELADVPAAPRQAVVLPEDITVMVSLIAGAVAAAAGGGVALIIVASGGGTVAAVVGTLLAALVAGAIAAAVTIRTLRPPQSKALEPIMAARGLILWVRVRALEREDEVKQILRQNGGQAIRVHEIEVAKYPEDIPLSSVRPDPWLGDERLGRPEP